MTYNNKELEECLFKNKNIYEGMQMLQDNNKRKWFFFFCLSSIANMRMYCLHILEEDLLSSTYY